MVSKSTDVFVIGGGPAGLAAAIAARLKGFHVTLADAARPPIDKACGEGLMPDSLNVLRKLGVEIPGGRSFPFRGIRFLSGETSVAAKFPSGSGIGIGRVRLHEVLIERAAELGVRMHWGARVTGIAEDSVFISGEATRCRWIIGADGQNSHVRCWAALEEMHSELRRFGFRRHYRITPWTDSVEIYWANGCQIYVTPIAPEEVCVALLTRDSHQRLEDALTLFPKLAGHLCSAAAVSPERGAVTVSRRLRHVFRGSTVLIGDASGSVDAITGDGLCLSFQQSIALADALAAEDVRLYESAHQRLARRPAFMGRLMLTLDRSPWLRHRVMQAFMSRPEIFANLLAMHVGELSVVDFISAAMLPLGWRILTA